MTTYTLAGLNIYRRETQEIKTLEWEKCIDHSAVAVEEYHSIAFKELTGTVGGDKEQATIGGSSEETENKGYQRFLPFSGKS